jgi:hypothetical protein
VRRRDLDFELAHQPRQARRLALGQVEDEPGQGGGVDDRVLERALEPAADQPRVEGVMAVLDENGALREAQERAASVFELRGADEHGPVDVVPLARVRVDRRAAVDEGVEEREGGVEPEALGADLEHQERRVAGRLHVEGDELGGVEQGQAADLGRVDRDLLPGHRLARAARFQKHGLRAHDRAIARARRAQRISSPVRRRSSSTAAAYTAAPAATGTSTRNPFTSWSG